MSTTLPQTDLPPEYEQVTQATDEPSAGNGTPPSPREFEDLPGYSQSPRTEEYLVDESHFLGSYSGALPPTTALPPRVVNGKDIIFRGGHLEVNLGPQLWTRKAPSYGVKGVITGTVRVFDDRAHIDNIMISLKGTVSISRSEVALNITSHMSTTLVKIEKTLYSSESNDKPWREPFNFAFPIPRLMAGSADDNLPPTGNIVFRGANCAIDYTFKVDMVRKGMRRHETITIPVWYLPKSRPREAPQPAIPRVALDGVKPPHLNILGMTTVIIEPQRSCRLFLTFPSPNIFTSGRHIPVLLSLVCPQYPELVKALQDAKVCMVKRIRMWSTKNGPPDQREIVISSAESRRVNRRGVPEGYAKFLCTLRAGGTGLEASWGVKDVVDVQYFIRVALTAQVDDGAMLKLPVFRHDELVKITTDSWNTESAELVSTGGTSAPATGLNTWTTNP